MYCLKCIPLFLLGFKPRTFRVLGKRDDHYTTETCLGTTARILLERRKEFMYCLKCKPLFLLGFKPRTFRVLGKRDDHYTTETPQFLSCALSGKIDT